MTPARSTPRSRRRALAAALVAVSVATAALSVSACGGGAPHATVLPVPPPQAVLSLTFLLVPARESAAWAASTNDAIEAAFIKAGYKITKDERDPHDAVIAVELSATEKPSAITFYRDGQRIVDYAVRVNLTAKEASGIIDVETHELVASGGQTDSNDAIAAVNQLSDALRFKMWAIKLVASRTSPGDPATPAAAPSVDAPTP